MTVNPLTPREMQILELVSEGLQKKQVAARLGISVETVRNRTVAIFDKLGPRTMPGAVAEAFHRGLLVPRQKGSLHEQINRLIAAAQDLRAEVEE